MGERRLAENVRIPSYGEGLKLLKKRHMIFERSPILLHVCSYGRQAVYFELCLTAALFRTDGRRLCTAVPDHAPVSS